MSVAWTPGPWTPIIRPAMGTAAGCTVATIMPEGPYRGDVTRSQSAEHIDGIAKDELIANAHLIAAAPDLYAALERALNFIANTEGEMGEPLSCGDIARAALAKARGEA